MHLPEIIAEIKNRANSDRQVQNYLRTGTSRAHPDRIFDRHYSRQLKGA